MLRAIPIVVVLFLTSAPGLAQTLQARLTGRITDGSGGALPGVTVTITSDRLAAPIIQATDDIGRYTSPALPAGTYSVSFELPGFEPQVRERIEVASSEVVVLDREMGVAKLAESVEVVAAAPPAPAPFPPFEPPPPIEAQPIPQELLAAVCGPGRPEADHVSLGTIVGHREERTRTMFGSGDAVVLTIGADFGAHVGQNYVVRRRFRVGDKHLPPPLASFGEQTAGLVQVVQTAPDHSIAVVVHACGELFAGDSVEIFEPLPALSARLDGTPRFDEPAHIIFGENGQAMGATRQLMVIDRGSAEGAARGQRLTIFRRAQGEHGPVNRIADGVVVVVRERSATIRIDRASDAVTIGDLVALYR